MPERLYHILTKAPRLAGRPFRLIRRDRWCGKMILADVETGDMAAIDEADVVAIPDVQRKEDRTRGA